MKKLILVCVLLAVLTGCTFLTGTKRIETKTDPDTGKVTTSVTYEDAPISAWAALLAAIVPAAGAGIVAAGSMAKRAARAKEGVMDSLEDAMKEADWKDINSAQAFKDLLELYQDSHKDAEIIAKEFKKWKSKRT